MTSQLHETNGTRRAPSAWTWVFGILTATLWFVQMCSAGFSKPEHDDRDPVAAAGYNHQQNLAWSHHVALVCAAPVGGVVIGVLIAGLFTGSRLRPGSSGVIIAASAFLSSAAYCVYLVVTAFENVYFSFRLGAAQRSCAPPTAAAGR